jgi:hypothetical protein
MEVPQRSISSRFAPTDKSVATATTLGLVLWISTTYWYKKSPMIHDKNLFNLLIFGTGSLFSSMAVARFAVETPYAAAARRNNEQEMRHQKRLGHI